MKYKLKSGELMDSAAKALVGFGVGLIGDIIVKKLKRINIMKNPDQALIGDMTRGEMKDLINEVLEEEV